MIGRPKLILASGSPRRVTLINQAGIEPDALRPANVDETPRRGELPRACANRLARAKAEVALDLVRADEELQGAYILADAPGGKPEVILIASGSEVSLAVQAHEKLLAEGIRSRVVSMSSWDIFEDQTVEYREAVLPPEVQARVAIEQASTFGWARYVGTKGKVVGMHTFGASAPLKELQKKFGFEPDQVVAVAKEVLQEQRSSGAREKRANVKEPVPV